MSWLHWASGNAMQMYLECDGTPVFKTTRRLNQTKVVFEKRAGPWGRVHLHQMGGDVAQLVQHWTGTPLMQVWFPDVARDFSPRVNFQCRLSHNVCTPLCAIACIYICAHVKNPAVDVRVRWIMETLKHPACTLGWVAQLCRSWLFPGEGNPNFPWEKSHWDNTVVQL